MRIDPEIGDDDNGNVGKTTIGAAAGLIRLEQSTLTCSVTTRESIATE